MTFDRLDTLIAFVTIMLGLSMVITILNQIIAGLLGHRAAYLKDGIVDVLVTLDPALKDQAKTIADNVLTHALSSDSIFAHASWAPGRWKMASAIQPKELAKLLETVSTGKGYETKIKAILSAINPSLAMDAQRLATLAGAVAPGATTAADQWFSRLAEKSDQFVGKLEAEFDSAMDRIRQRFTLQMRIWSVVFALLIALMLHLDAASLYARLSVEPSLRASVSGVSETLVKNYLDLQSSGGAGQAAKTPPEQAAKTPPGQTAPAPAATHPSPQEVTANTRKLASDFNEVKQALASTDLQIFHVRKDWYAPSTFDGIQEFFRILLTAGLLSLGAPFWYNALKSLMSLRSAVAQKQSEAKS